MRLRICECILCTVAFPLGWKTQRESNSRAVARVPVKTKLKVALPEWVQLRATNFFHQETHYHQLPTSARNVMHLFH